MRSEIYSWLQQHGYDAPVRTAPLSGGCINESRRLFFNDGATLVLKENPTAPADFFAQEAIGLDALAATDTLRTPKVYGVGKHFLLLEDLGQAPAGSLYWQQLGQLLAGMHSHHLPQFGFPHDNYCGQTPQTNSLCEDGWKFFAQHRITSLALQAQTKGLLDTAETTALLGIADRLQQLVPAMPAVLIHGDLWSGNIHSDENGLPALIDPACYWGWAEAELAMTLLFGGFPPEFYRAYSEYAALDDGWRERAPIYNLYHLLNHLLLFGGSYRSQIRQICDRFS